MHRTCSPTITRHDVAPSRREPGLSATHGSHLRGTYGPYGVVKQAVADTKPTEDFSVLVHGNADDVDICTPPLRHDALQWVARRAPPALER